MSLRDSQRLGSTGDADQNKRHLESAWVRLQEEHGPGRRRIGVLRPHCFHYRLARCFGDSVVELRLLGMSPLRGRFGKFQDAIND